MELGFDRPDRRRAKMLQGRPRFPRRIAHTGWLAGGLAGWLTVSWIPCLISGGGHRFPLKTHVFKQKTDKRLLFYKITKNTIFCIGSGVVAIDFLVKTNVFKQKAANPLLFYKKTKNILYRIWGVGNRFHCKSKCFQAKNTQRIAILQKKKQK